MNRKREYFKFLIVSMIVFLTLFTTSLSLVNSTNIQMDKISIYIDALDVDDYLEYDGDEWYEIRIIPEYKRLFGQYGDRIQSSDYDYEDWVGREYIYPPGISGGEPTKYYENNLQIEWSYCLSFDASAGNELYIAFKLMKYNPTETHTEIHYFGDDQNYNTFFWTDYMYYDGYGGGIRLYMKVVLM